MSRRKIGAFVFGVSLIALGVVLAQDTKPPGDLLAPCAKAIAEKAVLKDAANITLRQEGSDRIVVEGTVPTKFHACEVFLTCMSVKGVEQVDLAKLRVVQSEASLKSAVKPSLWAVVLGDDGKRDLVTVGDVPPYVIPDADRGLREYPSGNPGNSLGTTGAQGPTHDQPVAPANPGAYPDRR
jgi:hypothetical protein